MLNNIQMLTKKNGQSILAFVRKPFGKLLKIWDLPIKKTLRHPKADESAR